MSFHLLCRLHRAWRQDTFDNIHEGSIEPRHMSVTLMPMLDFFHVTLQMHRNLFTDTSSFCAFCRSRKIALDFAWLRVCCAGAGGLCVTMLSYYNKFKLCFSRQATLVMITYDESFVIWSDFSHFLCVVSCKSYLKTSAELVAWHTWIDENANCRIKSLFTFQSIDQIRTYIPVMINCSVVG